VFEASLVSCKFLACSHFVDLTVDDAIDLSFEIG